ncbi:Diphthamide biosynthesis protein 4 [Nowakowskiella sp. JEL0407]|nr:Diphthamide biosynthesis protein 4 [Nowakowskiella sp. JEL0407]
MNRRTYYDVLGVRRESDGDEIRRKYFALALKLHPDKNALVNLDCKHLKTVELEFQTINNAYETLKDPEKRLNYDNMLAASKKEGIVYSEVDLDDMTFYDEQDLSYFVEGHYEYLCRCGGTYKVTEEELEAGVKKVDCSSCSLQVILLYQPA